METVPVSAMPALAASLLRSEPQWLLGERCLTLQAWRWGRQYAAQLKGPPLLEMQRLNAWLEAHIPHSSDSDPAQTCIAHGDYRQVVNFGM